MLILMIPPMEKESKEYSLETLPILVEQLQTMLKETKVLELHGVSNYMFWCHFSSLNSQGY